MKMVARHPNCGFGHVPVMFRFDFIPWLDCGVDLTHLFAVETTFPIDQKELARRRRASVFGSLFTWILPLPALIAWTFLGLNTFIFLGIMIGAGFGLYTYWKKKLPQLEREWIEELSQKSNQQQNVLLMTKAIAFEKQGHQQEAKILREAVLLKKEIEEPVHNSELSQSHKEKLDTLVDTICFALVGKLEQHAVNPSVELNTELGQAIDILKETRNDLPNILNPAGELEVFESQDPLHKAITGLKDEAKLAKRVRKRLYTDWSHSEDSETTISSSHADISD